MKKKGLRTASSGSPVLYDIVKRRFVRVPPSEFGHGWKRSISAFVKWLGVDEGGPSQGMLNPLPMIGLPNRCHRTDLEKLVFSAKTVLTFGSGWALAMRMIKCLKGNWWMPWHAQAMKDVIRCDKRRGGANTL